MKKTENLGRLLSLIVKDDESDVKVSVYFPIERGIAECSECPITGEDEVMSYIQMTDHLRLHLIHGHKVYDNPEDGTGLSQMKQIARTLYTLRKDR